MLWVRKLLVSLFALLLLVALLSGVVSESLTMAFGTPTKVEQWLNESNLYNHFVSNAVGQAEQITSDTGQPTTISTDNAVVQQAIKSTFSQQLIGQSVNTFLDSNYAWLEGKTTTPQFKIDFSAPKAALAKQISQAVATHLASVPACSASQLSQLQTIDLLNLACRPPGVDPASEALQVEQQIMSSGGFLSNPVITADNLTPNKSSSKQSQPYYQQLSKLPKFFQLGKKVPYAFAALGLVSLVIIFLATPTKRKAWRLLAKLLIMAGVLLAVTRLAFDIAFNKVQDRLFSSASDGQLQQSLTDFVHRTINYVTHLELVGGIAYLILAALIIIGLLITRFTRRSGNKKQPATLTTEPAAPATPTDAETTEQVAGESQPSSLEQTSGAPIAPIARRKRPVMDVVGRPKPETAAGQATTAPEVVATKSPENRQHGLGRRGSIQ
jgi:hypothetical protein